MHILILDEKSFFSSFIASSQLSQPHPSLFSPTIKNKYVCIIGPCKASKPQLEALANKYSADVSKNVTFGIVYESDIGDAIHNYGVRAFPTYILFQNGSETNRVQGVNMAGIENMIVTASNMELTGGHTLNSGSAGATTTLSPAEARAARLAKLDAGSPAFTTTTNTTTTAPVAPAKKEPEDVEMNDAKDDNKEKETSAAAAADEDVKMENAANSLEEETEPEMVDPTTDLDPELIATLTEQMGFPRIRAQKGLLNGNARTVEAAVEWLTEHQEDTDIDEPIPLQPKGGIAQSYKCNDCGKILSNMANLELHANKTGHSDFEESTQAVKPLTAEEKTQKIAEIKELLKQKRAEREEAEKVDHVAREKSRRLMGQEMQKTREQMDQEQRKRDAWARKKEKEAARRERERIRAELEKDKLERKANKGKLNSRLGVDGYNPSAIQYDVDGTADKEDDDVAPTKKKSFASPAKIDEYIAKVSSYKAGGDGGKCLKMLKLMVGNIVDNPTEDKYKSIKIEGKAYKTKVKPFVGAKALLMAIGFSLNEEATSMILNDYDMELLKATKKKLEAAVEAF